MKSLSRLLIAIVLLWPCVAGAGIVHNSGSLGADSISMRLALLDTLGQPTKIDTTVDWGYLMVFYPGGDSCYSDSFLIAQSDAHIEIWTSAVFTDTWFTYKEAVSALDNAGLNGVYTWQVTLRDSSLKLSTPYWGEFDLVTQGDFAIVLDSAVKNHLWDNQAIPTPTVTGQPLVTVNDITDNAIGAADIAADAIGASELATDAIGAAEIASAAIAADEIATDAVGAAELAGGAATEMTDSTWMARVSKYKTQSTYTTAAFRDSVFAGAFTVGTTSNLIVGMRPNLDSAQGTLADAQVDLVGVDVQDWGTGGLTLGSTSGNPNVNTASITGNAITASSIAAGAITNSEIATDAIGADEVADGAITDGVIAAGAIDPGGELDTTNFPGALVWGHGTRTLTSAGTITAANMGSIADSVWRKGGAKVRLVDGDTTAIAMLYHIRDSMDEASATGAINLDLATGTLANSQIDDDVDVNMKTASAFALDSGDFALDARKMIAIRADSGNALRPTTAGRTLDVTAGGEAGIDLDNTAGTISTSEFAAETDIVSSGAITTSGGAVSTVTTVTNSIGTSLGASELDLATADKIGEATWSMANDTADVRWANATDTSFGRIIAQGFTYLKEMHDSLDTQGWAATGAGVAITAANMGQIADSVWGKDTSNTIWNGLSRFGEYNALAQAAVGSGSCAGAGSIACSLYARTSSGALSGARIFIYNSALTSLLYWNDPVGTNALGLSPFGLDPSTTYKITASKIGATYDSLATYQTIATPSSGKLIDTIPFTMVTIGPATTSGYKVVYGREYIGGDSLAGAVSGVVVTATLVTRRGVHPDMQFVDTLNDNSLGNRVVAVDTTNSTGFWQIAVPINTIITMGNPAATDSTFWDFSGKKSGQPERFHKMVYLNSTTSARLIDLAGQR